LGWTLKFKSSVAKDLARITPSDQRRSLDALEPSVENPRQQGKALSGDKRDLWSYRVGDYRIICDIQDREVVVLVVRIGHRRDVAER
jgi:mRNA interferase RelE/StbE